MWKSALFSCVLVWAGTAAAQQPPGAADLPASYRGGEIDKALAAHEWDRAEQALAAEIDRSPASPALLQILGRVFLIDRKPLNAAIAFKKAEAIRPLDAPTRFALVLAYISLNRREWARPELERLATADPANSTYQYWLGRLHYDAGQYRAAIERFERVVARDPGFVRAYDNLGLCYEAMNQPDQALAHYHTAVALNRRAASKSPWPPLNLAILLRNLGNHTESEALLREAVRYEDGLAQAHYQLGVLLEQEGRLDEAVAELTGAARRDAAYAEPHYALARVYRRLGREAEASAALAAFETLHDAAGKTHQQ
jgi:tetratricopeptide (TPR) repeat protein